MHATVPKLSRLARAPAVPPPAGHCPRAVARRPRARPSAPAAYIIEAEATSCAALDRDWGTRHRAFAHDVLSVAEPPLPDGCRALTEITFSLQHPALEPGEVVAVVGGDAQLGLWDPAGALRLRWSEETGCWVSGPVFVAAGTTLEYKFIVLDERSAVAKPHWQPGENSVLRVPQDSDGCRFGVAAPSFEAPPQAVAPAGSSLPRRILAKCFDCGACILPHLHSHRCPKLYGLAGWEPSQQAALADPAAAC